MAEDKKHARPTKTLDLLPVKVRTLEELAEKIPDPMEFPIAAVRFSKSMGNQGPRLHFGADRGYEHHMGIDLLYEPKTLLDLPISKDQSAFLIGMSKGGPLGYALVLFVPDEKSPYFLLLAHNDPHTMKLLSEKGIAIGSKLAIAEGSDNSFLFTGATGRVDGPHLHVGATTGFVERMRGPEGTLTNGRFHTAKEFMAHYKDDEKHFIAFLKRNNFPSLLIPAEYRHKGRHLDPLELINKGKIVLSGIPPKRMAKTDKKEAKTTLASY
ncbi:hypothetical protein HY988_05835 [Candidatus Micrarchaeota archaeon]|nr:hypothetical protein [Candidatus Micrarchaeota archaeon]